MFPLRLRSGIRSRGGFFYAVLAFRSVHNRRFNAFPAMHNAA